MKSERDNRLVDIEPQQISWPMGIFAAVTLLVSVAYASLALVFVPSLGIALDAEWRVMATTECQTNDWWCDALNPTLSSGNRVVAIGEVSFQEYDSNPALYIFSGLSSGDLTTLDVIRDGRQAKIPWRLPPLSARDRLMRVSETLLFVPFYFAATVLLLMLRPRSLRSRLLVSAFYVGSIWLVSSGLADSQAAFSAVVEHLAAWMLVALLWHLHLLFPSSLIEPVFSWPVVGLYGGAAVMGVLGAAGILPSEINSLAMAVATAGVCLIFIFRSLRPGTDDIRRANRLMAPAFLGTMLPLLIAHGGWAQLEGSQVQWLLLMAASLTTPIMPFLYLYIIQRRWVRGLRLGFHRQLAQYGFMLVYLVTYVILISMGARLIESAEIRVLFSLVVALVFIAATPRVNEWFRRGFVFLAVGARHDVDELSHFLASQLPQVRTFDELGSLLGGTILPGLLIRESALILLGEDECTLLYQQGDIDPEPLCEKEMIETLLADQRTYRPPGVGEPGQDDWIRLVVPLRSQERVIGLWLLGERHPDDFYSSEDISLISVLANQVMLGIDNMRRQQQMVGQTNELSMLYELLLASSATLDRRELLDTVYERLNGFISPDKFIVALAIPDKQACKVIYAIQDGASMSAIEGQEVSFDDYQRLGRAIEAAVLIKEDLTFDDGEHKGTGTWMGVPMVSQRELIGVLYFEANRPSALVGLDERLLETIGGQLATTLSNVELYEEATRRALEQEAVNRIIAAASKVADVPELLNIALDRLMLALGIAQGVIWLEEPEITFVRGFEDQTTLQDILEGIKMIRPGGESSVVENWLEVPASIDPWAKSRERGQAPIGASLSVPLLAEGHILGGLALVSPKPRRWDGNEIHLSAIIGRQIGGAIERLNLLDQIRQQAEQMQGILETMGEGLMTLTQDNRIALANSIARDYLELLSDHEPGGQVTHLGGMSIDQVVASSREGLPYEVVADGTPQRVFEIQANRGVDSTGYGEWTLLIREVTDIRRAQNQSQLHERLAAVGQIAAGIAHDFNNIVASILLFSEMLMAEPELTERGRDRLAAITHQAQQAANLTRQILDFGRQTGVDLKPVDLIPLLGEETKMLQRTLPANIKVMFESSLQECFVSANPGQMGQLLLNLVLNARDAQPEGGEIKIELSDYELFPNQRPPIDGMLTGRWMQMVVRDKGKGIPPEILDRIFEPFFTTKAPGEGTGLGLAQVYGIVQQHSGFIDVSSRPEVGTEFVIFLPTLKLSTSPQAEASMPAAPSGTGERILVVEDQEGIREAVCQVLEKLNYQVICVNNGEAAQKTLEEHEFRFDLIVSDVVMPKMGGMALNRWLLETAPDIKLILMTGYPMGDGTRELLDPDRVRLLHKPMDSTTLAQTVDEMLAMGDSG
jgi:signal transduction histidine kinase/GAF domain-containing protein/CheY-like chemotaxis protein